MRGESSFFLQVHDDNGHIDKRFSEREYVLKTIRHGNFIHTRYFHQSIYDNQLATHLPNWYYNQIIVIKITTAFRGGRVERIYLNLWRLSLVLNSVNEVDCL